MKNNESNLSKEIADIKNMISDFFCDFPKDVSALCSKMQETSTSEFIFTGRRSHLVFIAFIGGLISWNILSYLLQTILQKMLFKDLLSLAGDLLIDSIVLYLAVKLFKLINHPKIFNGNKQFITVGKLNHHQDQYPFSEIASLQILKVLKRRTKLRVIYRYDLSLIMKNGKILNVVSDYEDKKIHEYADKIRMLLATRDWDIPCEEKLIQR